MVINIDIKISDGDGNLLHRYKKGFDENTSNMEKLNTTNLRKSFQDFLSEYMSSSGYAVREKLLPNYITSPVYCNGPYATDINPTVNWEMTSGTDDNEMEYKIRIGNRDMFTGKIPLKLLPLSPAADDNDTLEDDKYTDNLTDNYDKTSKQAEIRTSSKVSSKHTSDNKEAAINTMINYALHKAIEKYEANLYPINNEDAYEFWETEYEIASCST